MQVKCLNCKKHRQKENRHTCSANINVYVLGILQEPLVLDCMEYDPIIKHERKKPWGIN